MKYETFLKDFLIDKKNRKYASVILEKLTDQYRHGDIAQIRRERSMMDRMQEVVDALVNDAVNKKRYTSSILPTVVSSDQAPNFWFKNEKEPTREEAYRSLYTLLTGLYQGNYVVNLDNADEPVMREFRSSFIRKMILPESDKPAGIDIKKVHADLGIRVFPYSEFGFSLLILSYFVSWIKDRAKARPEWMQKVSELGLSSALSELNVEDTVTLVTFNIRKQKKEMYITPRMKSFVLRWYEDFLMDRERSPYILSFLSSIYVSHKNYRKISTPLMNKFIYYLLRENVNGKLLTDLINLKVESELKERQRPYPIQQAKKFFASLHQA